MAELERLVVNIVKFEVKTEAKMGAWREEIMAWEATKLSVEKSKTKPDNTRASVKEMEAAVENGLEEMKARMDVDGNVSLEKTEANTEAGQNQRKPKVRLIWKKWTLWIRTQPQKKLSP